MDEKSSIPEIKLKMMLQEASDKLREIDNNQPKNTAYTPSPAPPGAPRKTFMNDAFNKMTSQWQKDQILKKTKEKFEDFLGKENPEKKQAYKDTFHDWEKDPAPHATPENKEQNENIGLRPEPNKDATTQIGRKHLYVENQKMFEDNRPTNTFTRQYNSSLNFSKTTPDPPNGGPSKDDGPNGPGE